MTEPNRFPDSVYDQIGRYLPEETRFQQERKRR